MQFQKILFPTDFSPCGDEALELATALARDTGAKLLIVHVEEPPMAYGTGLMYYGPTEPTQDQLVEMLHKVIPKDSAVPYEHHLLLGNPADEITAFAESQSVDLIVIGTHGRTGVFRMLMGSVAELVVRHANCPVATFKHPKHKASDES
jgi:nucleotide-binding universal stress UspA family protein